MTNTKFRKRALLSSVAMLLVALVALGSATFAWFTSSTTAKATGLAITTTKSSELKVAKLDLKWADSVNYDDEAATYVPASSSTGANWYTAVADKKTEFTAKSNTYAQAQSLNGVVYKEMLNIKNFGGKTAKGVKITVDGSFASPYGRLAIVPATAAQTTKDVYPAFTPESFKANIYGSGTTDSWKPYNGTSVESNPWSLKGAADGTTITVGDMAANAVKSYVLFVWFEGEDPDCYDLSTGALTFGDNSDVTFTVTSDPN